MNNNEKLKGILPENPLPVLSNIVLSELIDCGALVISPFDSDMLAATCYRMTPAKIRFHMDNDKGLPQTDSVLNLDDGVKRAVRPGEFVVVSPKERISLCPGVVADFFPSSWCIENRLLVTAGRLDAGYEGDLVFGVFNAGRDELLLDNSFQLMRATFSWLGRNNIPNYENVSPGAYIPGFKELRA